MITVSQVNIWPVESSKLKANGSFVVNDAMRVKFVIGEKDGNLYVGYPGDYYVDKKTNQKKWGSKVDFVDKDTKTNVDKTLLAAYNSKVSGDSTDQGPIADPEPQVTTKKVPANNGIPF